MKNITDQIGTLYHPKAALLFYASDGEDNKAYVEHFDIGEDGMPVNAHPLSVREADELCRALQVQQDGRTRLMPEGIIGTNVLYLDTLRCRAVWYTKAVQRTMYFTGTAGIPDGNANVPPMLWCADGEKLSVYALANNRRPLSKATLYHAPFFNVYADGNVCMGTVEINISADVTLEEFTSAWETYFFNSRFSHLFNGHNPVNGNCATIWNDLVGTGKPFPMESLKKSSITIKDLTR